MSEELRHLASLPLELSAYEEGDPRDIVDDVTREVFSLYGKRQLRPNWSLRHQLEEELAFIAEAPRAQATKHGMVSGLIGAYLRGEYRPDTSLREEMQYKLTQLGLATYGQSEGDAARAVYEAVRPYFREIGVFGKPHDPASNR